jgi:hypothetical protein
LLKSKDIFDEELFEQNVLMTKLEFFQTPGKLREIYDDDLGLDILLCDDEDKKSLKSLCKSQIIIMMLT